MNKIIIVITIFQIISAIQVNSKADKFATDPQLRFYSIGSNKFDYFIEVLNTTQSNIEFTILLKLYIKGKLINDIALNLTGVNDKNPAIRNLTDECSRTSYPVDCYKVENDSCSFELFISIWDDRAFFVDKGNYFGKKYFKLNIEFKKTFRRI